MRIQALGFMALFFVFGSAYATQDTPPSDASIHELLQVTHSHKLLDSVMGQMDGMVRKSTQQALAGQPIDAGVQKILEAQTSKINDLMKSQMTWASLEPMYINLYRETFTQKEVNDMLAFYRSPTGQSMVVKMPVLMGHLMQTVQSKLAAVLPQMQKIEQDTASQLKAYEASKAAAAPAAANGSK